MGSKFIIFAVFASLAQCSLTLRSTVTDRLSDGDAADDEFSQITTRYEEKALQYAPGAAHPIFDVNQNYVSILVGSFDAVTTDDASKINEAASNAKAAVDTTLDAIKVVFRGSCSATIEQSRKAALNSVDEMYEFATKGWYLGVNRDFSKNREQIEAYERKAQKSYVDLNDNVFDSIRKCVNSKDPKVVALIQNLQDQVASLLNRVVSTFFLGTKFYATADPDNRSNLLVTQALRSEAVAGYVSTVENMFSGIRTLNTFHSMGMDNTGRLPAVLANEYFGIGTPANFKKAIGTVLSLIRTAAKLISLGSSGSSMADFSAIDFAKARTISYTNAGNTRFFKAALASNPNANEEVATTEAEFLNFVPEIVASFVEPIIVAQDSDISYAESMEKIENSREKLLLYAAEYAKNFMGLIGINKPLDTDTEGQLSTLENEAEVAAKALMNSIADSMEILAKCADKGNADEKDFAELQANQDMSFSAIDDYVRPVREALILFY